MAELSERERFPSSSFLLAFIFVEWQSVMYAFCTYVHSRDGNIFFLFGVTHAHIFYNTTRFPVFMYCGLIFTYI